MSTYDFIPYGSQNIDESDIEEVVKVLKSSHLTQGPAVEEFENMISSTVKSDYTIATTNGTSALHTLYQALDFDEATALIVPGITFAATSNPALYCRSKVFFCDVELNTGCMSPDSAEEALTLAKKQGFKKFFIIPVHFAGLPAKIKEIKDLSARFDAIVLEDGCHAIGAEWRENEDSPWKPLGHQSAVASTWSFHPVKHITTGEGGAITTDNEKLAIKARLLRSHGITRSKEHMQSPPKPLPPWYYEMVTLGLNYRLSDIHAALGLSQLRKLDRFIEIRRRTASTYHSFFLNNDIQTLTGDTDTSKHSYHLFVITPDWDHAERDEAMVRLKAKNIGTQLHYQPVFNLPFYQKEDHLWDKVESKNCQRLFDQMITIPMNPNLSEDKIKYICDSVAHTVKSV